MKRSLTRSLCALIITLVVTGDAYAAQCEKLYREEVYRWDGYSSRQLLEREKSAQRCIEMKNEARRSDPEAQGAYSWFNANQVAGTGLVTSHPEDTSFIYHEGIVQEWAKIPASTQAYTYDQALGGIVMVKHGDWAGADKILDFFYSEIQNDGPQFTGFWTVYNTQADVQWKRYEWRKGMGETAWIGLFAMQYADVSCDPARKAKALEVAVKAAQWIGSLAHYEGAVAMGPNQPSGNPNYGTIYSVENNLDYFSFLEVLKKKAPLASDRQFFESEYSNLKSWLKTKAYDPVKGLFQRGGQASSSSGPFVWDGIASLDVNSWAIAAIGADKLQREFGINLPDFMTRIENAFSVQNNGAFGGPIGTAKGFDFSDALNASLIGRTGVKWVEGTNQMILAYRLLTDHFVSSNRSLAKRYRARADYFESRNADNKTLFNGTTGYLYADVPGVQIFLGTTIWKTSAGQAAPSAAWVYLASRKINPFRFRV